MIEKNTRKVHEAICRKIRDYVENPDNFKDGPKSMRAVAKDLLINYQTVRVNLKIMHGKEIDATKVTLQSVGSVILVDNHARVARSSEEQGA